MQLETRLMLLLLWLFRLVMMPGLGSRVSRRPELKSEPHAPFLARLRMKCRQKEVDPRWMLMMARMCRMLDSRACRQESAVSIAAFAILQQKAAFTKDAASASRGTEDVNLDHFDLLTTTTTTTTATPTPPRSKPAHVFLQQWMPDASLNVLLSVLHQTPTTGSRSQQCHPGLFELLSDIKPMNL